MTRSDDAVNSSLMAPPSLVVNTRVAPTSSALPFVSSVLPIAGCQPISAKLPTFAYTLSAGAFTSILSFKRIVSSIAADAVDIKPRVETNTAVNVNLATQAIPHFS